MSARRHPAWCTVLSLGMVSCAYAVEDADYWLPLEAGADAGGVPFGAGGSAGAMPFPSPAPAPLPVPAPAPTPPPESAGMDCDPGFKRCGGVCVPPGPGVGCNLDECDACPEPPEHATSICRDSFCNFECDDGYTRGDGVCLPPVGTGGTTSTGGSTGTGAALNTGGATTSTGGTTFVPSPPPSSSCNASTCASCSVIGPFPCCTDSGRCGCTWAPGAYCL